MGGEFRKILKVKGISLLSGGLDSIIATKVIQEQGIYVLGVTFETPFFSARKAIKSAVHIGLPLSVIDLAEDHLNMVKAPRYGYGKNMNPCIDCHTLMLKKAGEIMEKENADFIFTGEVLGQRPMSQNRQSLYTVAKNSGYGEYVVRPLSAKLLPETKPEMDGKINREKLLDIQGKGRKQQLALAKHYGIAVYSSPAGGCLLTDPRFSVRLKDLFAHKQDFTVRDVELLKVGRHFRTADLCKVIIGRNSHDNETLLHLSHAGDTIIHMANYPGPTVLVQGVCPEETLHIAASLCAFYSDAPHDREVLIESRTGNQTNSLKTRAARRELVEHLMV